MANRRRSPLADIDENHLEVGHAKHQAAGVPGVAVALRRAVDEMGPTGRHARCSASDVGHKSDPQPQQLS